MNSDALRESSFVNHESLGDPRSTIHAPRSTNRSSFIELRKAWAYLKKEWLIQASYKFAFLLSLFGMCTSIAAYFFIDRMFGRRVTPDLAPFGASYFAYALVGNAFFAYIGTALGGVSGRLAMEQSLGTLEAVLVTPTKLWVLIGVMAAWNTLYASMQVVLYGLVGGVGFGVDFSRANWVSVLGIMGLVVVSFNSIGLLEAACVLVFKRGAVVAWALNGVWALLGGVLFPVTVLPVWLQRVAAWIPITHAIRGLQLAMYQGTPLTRLARECAVLGGFCVVLVPLGWWSWQWALRRAKIDGSLAQY